MSTAKKCWRKKKQDSKHSIKPQYPKQHDTDTEMDKYWLKYRNNWLHENFFTIHKIYFNGISNELFNTLGIISYLSGEK